MSRKQAVVVGATGNLGQAICEELSAQGFDLAPEWLDSQKRPDATKAASYQNLPSKIDAAIYVAGINKISPIENLSEEDWDLVLDTNLKGAFLFAKAALAGLRQGSGATFVTISSIMATHPYPNRTAYAAAKAGLEGLTRTLAVEWGQYNIATHSIRLGHLSGLMRTTPPNHALLDAVKSKTPLSRLIEPKDVAQYIAWLVNGGSKSVTGGVIDFDPGYILNRWPL